MSIKGVIWIKDMMILRFEKRSGYPAYHIQTAYNKDIVKNDSIFEVLEQEIK